MVRFCAVLAVAVAAAGCANQRPEAVYGYRAINGVSSPANAAEGDIDAEVEARQVGKKTLAAKVLAAIALERVTGRKPDPARLTELY